MEYCEIYEPMFEEFELCSELHPSQIKALLSECVSDCEVLSVPTVPRTIKVPGLVEL